jgi:hypothetical protein
MLIRSGMSVVPRTHFPKLIIKPGESENKGNTCHIRAFRDSYRSFYPIVLTVEKNNLIMIN